MIIEHNMPAINAKRYLNKNNKKLSKSLEKLSSGYQINRAGDNAAGLAVSEKMRSQIAGMTQAVKNAQDGISMVQTFEGALTETHGILQRMKTLSDQMANGSYDDPVDRTAAQQEFSQLTDEVNQIADTDFNGIIILNGGMTADGIKAINGKFDYSDVLSRGARHLGRSDVNLVDDQHWDNSVPSPTLADAAWRAMNSAWTRITGQPDTYGPDSVDATFRYDQTLGRWDTISATNGADMNNIIMQAQTDNGGFAVKIRGVGTPDDCFNVVLDETNLAHGDTITLTFHNPATGISAPTNAGATQIDAVFTQGGDTNAVKLADADLKVSLGNAITAQNWKSYPDYNELMKLLDGAVVETAFDNRVTAAGDLKITLTNGTVLKSFGSDTFLKVGNREFTLNWTAANNKLEIKDTIDGAVKTLVTIEGAAQTAAATAPAKLSTGTISYRLGFEHYEYDAAAKPFIEVAKTGNVSISNAFRKAESVMTYSDRITLQVGARTKDGVNFTFEYASTSIGDLKDDLNCSASGLGIDKLSIATQEEANAATDKIDQAINKVSLIRGTFGAIQNRLDHKIDNLNVSVENLTSAESQIRDTNMAEEMMSFTKNQILAQASQSMLAQANQLPQDVLSLLQ